MCRTRELRGIGAGEHVGPRALGKLGPQRLRPGEAEGRLVARLRVEGPADLGKGVRQAARRKDRQPRRVGSPGEQGEQQQGTPGSARRWEDSRASPGHP